jgi:uncharacterized protein involved in exopolysaccharide biosynthesis
MMNDEPLSDLPDEEDSINLLDILQTLAENARLLVYGPILAGLIALGISFTFQPSYVAETNIMTPQQQGGAAAALSQLGALAGLAGAATGLKSPAEMYIGLLKSRTIADKMVDRFSMMSAPGIKTREDARKLLARISGMVARRDGQITIGVVSNVPGLSAAMANAYVEELSLLTSRLAVIEAQQRRLFLEKELNRAKENLVRAETALGGVGVSESVLKFNPLAMGEGLATLKAQIVAKEVQLSSMRGYLTQNSPNYRQAQQELAALRAQENKLDRAQPTSGNAEYISRYREFKYSETQFEQLSRQYELAKIDESSEGAVIQVVDVAVPPEEKSNTSKALVAILATLASGVVLVMFVFARRALRNADQNPDTAAKLATIRAGFKRVLKPWRRSANTGHSAD